MSISIDPKKFWEDKIIGWEKSRYGQDGLSLDVVGKVSSSLRYRMLVTVTLLRPHIQGKKLVDLGCGSGLLSEALMEAGASSYLGIDISENAINNAKALTANSKYSSNISFKASPIMDLEAIDDAVIFSLGLFDWLSPQEIDHIFKIGKNSHYLHAIAEKRASFHQFVHRIYVYLSYGYKSGGYVPQYHSIEEITRITNRYNFPEPNVYRDGRMSFGILLSDLPMNSSKVEI